jgi:uncharacterized protein
MTHDEKLKVARAYIAATRAGDAEARAAMTEPDAVTWHNFDDVAVDQAHSERTVAWLRSTAPDVTWDDVDVVATSKGFVWQSVLRGTGPGGPFRANTCLIVTVSDNGKIARMDEYLDTAQLKPLTG